MFSAKVFSKKKSTSYSIDFALLQFINCSHISCTQRQKFFGSGIGLGWMGWIEISVCTDSMSTFGANNNTINFFFSSTFASRKKVMSASLSLSQLVTVSCGGRRPGHQASNFSIIFQFTSYTWSCWMRNILKVFLRLLGSPC